MLYRGEVHVDKRVKIAQNFQATHPKQVIRRLLGMVRGTSLEFMNIYVMNEIGQIWMYSVRQIPGGIFKATLTTKLDKYIPANVSNNVFAGNSTIREVM